ncbi:MAG: serine/threonine protein kinase, partial [Gammaproteobacteria bacterium]|nr:serine/threonine protein kinase [Gammaproteobacteria bacterium]
MAAASYRNALGPGTRLHWYQIEKVLGHGGFGITYLARDGNLGKFVAIKEYLPVELAVRGADLSVVPIIDRHRQHYEWGLERFLSEARTLSKFKHHNIVSVVAVFEANNTAYMVMQYEKGESLAEILRRFGTLAEAEIIRHMLPLLDGLKNVHEAGFIHRDIKPANIFTRKGGASSVLLDFGSARHALSLETRTLTNLVSAGYSPYEQYSSRSDEQGPWTDIYAAGATLYHMVAGAPPLDAIERGKGMLGSSKDILKPAVEAGRGRYSPHFLAAIDHALMFNQDDRPQTVSEWLTDFHEATGVVRYRRRPDVSRPPKTKHEDTAVQPDTVPPRAESTPPPEEWTTVSAADAGKPPLEVKGSRMWKGVAAASIVLLAGLVVWYAAWRDWQLDSDARTQVVPPSDAQIAAAQEQEAQKLLAELKAEALRLQSLREDANLLSEKLAAGRSELSEIEQKRTDEEQRL